MLTRWSETLDKQQVLQEYPRPQLVRESFYNLNGLWDYAITASDACPGAWDGQILVPFSPEAPLSGVGKTLRPGQVLWYRRPLPLKKRAGMRTLLHFGAVDQRAVDAVAGDLTHDELRVLGVQRLPVQTELFQAGRAGASDEYVRLGEHVLHELEVLGIFQIQRDTLFAAVENIVDGVLFRRDGHAHRAAVVTAEVADRRGLNAHDTRAHVAQEPRRRRRGPVAGHLDHEQSLEWFSHGYSLLVDADFFLKLQRFSVC